MTAAQQDDYGTAAGQVLSLPTTVFLNHDFLPYSSHFDYGGACLDNNRDENSVIFPLQWR
jgi:hypothetical protein